MKEAEASEGVLDGEDAFPDFLDPEWRARNRKEAGLEPENSEFSIRARKKKRIYKRKKTEKKLDA